MLGVLFNGDTAYHKPLILKREKERGCIWSVEIVTYANNIIITAAAIFSTLYFEVFADIENGDRSFTDY